ncbi:MAG TPA: glycosyltransferase family 9 protein [Verrucomicrobiae bacterium]|nr:glycosyltransferase family 9 protein [Verrucomicrobiae bacterium]
METQIPKRPAARFKGRLMLCNIGRVGDTILRNSILDSGFRTYSTVDYICGPNNVELIRADPRINRITVLRNSISGFASLLMTAARGRYDNFIELKDHWSSTSVLITGFFRSRVKTGWNSDRFKPFHRDVRTVYEPQMHKIEMMRRVAELAGLEPGEYKATLVLPADSVRWFDENYKWKEPFIFLNISATSEDRMWPTMNWARYVRSCGLEGPILVNGVPKDRDAVHQLCAELPGSIAFRPRQFMDVAAALNRARLVLTVDTGVVHACSALNRPIIALGHSGKEYSPLSTRTLMIRTRDCTVRQFDPELAIAETLRHGLP